MLPQSRGWAWKLGGDLGLVATWAQVRPREQGTLCSDLLKP